MKNKKLKIYFADFWLNFKLEDNYFFHLLKTKYDVVISPDNPDILFYSVDYLGKSEYKKYKSKNIKKIFFTGENKKPNYEIADYSFSFEESNDKNYRLPLWVTYIDWFNSTKDKKRDPSFLIPLEKLTSKRSLNLLRNPFFCSFIASKPMGKRTSFVPQLNERKKVHCLGNLYSNSYMKISGRGDQKKKIDIMKLFKFNIAFENEISDGYVTEKILHSLYANTIPIYWGTSHVKNDFNDKAFIYFNDFESDEELIERIFEVSNNKREIRKYLDEPIFKNNEIPDFAKPHNVLKFLTNIIES